jgi:RHS repeat-associated protein
MKTKLLLLFSFCASFCNLVRGSDFDITIFNDNSCDKIVYITQTLTASCFGDPPGTTYPVNNFRVHAGQTFHYFYHGVCSATFRATAINADIPGSEYEIMPSSSAVVHNVVLGNDPTQCTYDVDHDDPPDGKCHGGSGCSSCGGMTQWSVSEPYVSLHLQDEPLGYQPVRGSRISFQLDFKQREFGTGQNPAFYSVGKRWNFSWYSLVTLVGSSTETVHLPDGKEITFQGSTEDYLTNTKLSGNTNTGFTLSYPDGSQDVYGFVVTNTAGAFLEAFRTEQWNPQSQKTLFYYDSYSPGASPVVRLRYVVDGDGRTNSVYYVASNTYSTNLIDHVVDAFGRTNFLSYDNAGHLTNITDVAGITSSFALSGDMVSTLTTPYGSTGFQITTATNARSVLITQPDGGHQLYVYQDSTPGLPPSYPTAQVPVTSPFANTFDTNNLDLHNSFYWGPRQYANLSTTNMASFTTNDFFKGRMDHWLSSTYRTPGDTLSMERQPSPDAAGTIEGQKTWYDYAGKTNNAFEGTQVLPLFIAQILSDGTTRFTRSLRNGIGAVTSDTSTYSVSSGSTVLLRTNSYVYDPAGIDLFATTNALGVLVSSNIYNGNHEVITNYDALNEITTYTYDTSNRLTSVTSPTGLITTNTYGGDGFLTQQIVVGFTTNSYTYTNGLVYTHTDGRGLTTTNTWDNLQRLRRVDYPDGTFITNTYQNLSLVSSLDRLGFTNSYGYDSMQRKIAETNAMGNYTIYNYCTCGSLDSIRDPAGNLTYFYCDNLSRATNTVYVDGYAVTNQFNLIGQITNTTDSSGVSVTNWFNNQGSRVAVSNAFSRVQTMAYDVLDRATNSVDVNSVSVNTTYDNLNRPLTRTYPDGGTEQFGYALNVMGMITYTNQLLQGTLYGYDRASRKIAETNANLEVTQFGYSGPGDLLTLTDGKNQITSWTYDQFGRTTNKLDAAGSVIFVYSYDADNRLTNRWTPVTSNTVYFYDAVGNLTTVRYQHATNNFAYDVMNRLTNMMDAVGTTTYTYDQAGQVLSEDGPWDNDTVSYTYQNRLRTGLSLPAPNASPWAQSYGYDAGRRLTNVTSQAGSFGYFLGGASSASPLTKKLLFPNGAYITNYYDGNARLLGTYLRNSADANLDTYDYIYNPGNQRTQEVFVAGNFMNYSYDNIGQLKTAFGKEPGGVTNRMQEQLSYVYDAAGNLNYRTNNTLLQQFNVNNLNEFTTGTNGGKLTVAGTTTGPATNVTVNGANTILYVDATFASTNQSWANGNNTYTAIAKDTYGRTDSNTITANLSGTNLFAYDLNGNMLTNTTRTFEYDNENQLIRITQPNSWKSEFSYDGRMRRRIRKEYAWNGSWLQTNEVHYIYDGNLVIQERDENNLPQVTYTRGSDLSGSMQGAGGIGGLLARTANPSALRLQLSTFATAFYHADGNGNVTCLIYTNQTVAAKYEYDPFGLILSENGPLADANLYRFSSKEYHPASTSIYYLYRYYVPNLQRWMNRDPAGMQGGVNLYNFIGNLPVNQVDPFGLDWHSLPGGGGYLDPGDYRGGGNDSGYTDAVDMFINYWFGIGNRDDGLSTAMLNDVKNSSVVKSFSNAALASAPRMSCGSSGKFAGGIDYEQNFNPQTDFSGFSFKGLDWILTGNWQLHLTASCSWACAACQSGNKKCNCGVTCNITGNVSKLYTFTYVGGNPANLFTTLPSIETPSAKSYIISSDFSLTVSANRTAKCCK